MLDDKSIVKSLDWHLKFFTCGFNGESKKYVQRYPDFAISKKSIILVGSFLGHKVFIFKS